MERKEWSNGPHMLEFEPPDIFHCHIRGPVLVNEVQETVRIMQSEVMPQVGPVFFFAHLSSGLEGFPAETRKYFGSIPVVWKGAAIIGGSAIARAATNVALRAMSLLSAKQPPTRMFKSVEEARVFAAEMRTAGETQVAKS